MPSFARERAQQPRGGSNVHTFIPVLLERLEAENTLLRRSVVELVLQIQALRDALGRPQPPRLCARSGHSLPTTARISSEM